MALCAFLLASSFQLLTPALRAQQVQGYPTIQVPNAPSGTQQGNLVKLDNTASGFRAVNAATTDLKIFGIATANAGATGSVLVQVGGLANCNFDGPTTAGDYVTISVSAPGYCSDAGTNKPFGQLVGIVRTTNPGSGTYQLELFTPSEISGAAQFITATAFTAGTPYTAGKSACLVASNVVQDCTVAQAAGAIGVNAATNTGGLAVVIRSGLATVTSTTSSLFTAGDFVCTDPANAGTFVDNGSTDCQGTQAQIGTVAVSDTSLSTSHTVLVMAPIPFVNTTSYVVTPLYGIATPQGLGANPAMFPPCNALRKTWCTVRSF